MSTLSLITTPCTTCGQAVQAEIAIMVNCDRRPDLRQSVIDGDFNRVGCSCGHRMTVVRTVGFWDWERKQFLIAYPRWAEVHWRDLARSTSEKLLRNLATAAPVGMAKAVGQFTTRVVFGYDGLREKFVIWDAGIDEIAVERAKLAIMSTDPTLAGRRVWLWEVTPDELRWVFATDPVRRVVTSHELLDAPLPEGMSRLELMADAFVDHRRWFVSPQSADPLAFDLDGKGHLHAGGAQLREPFDDR